MFVGSVKTYNLFKKYDLDKDGYISLEDFSNSMESAGFITKAESERVFDWMASNRMTSNPKYLGYN